jgi:hypothetical protein
MTWSRAGVLVLALIVVYVAALQAVSARPEGANAVGGTDFIQYWSAYRVATDGADAYDPVPLKVEQDRVGFDTLAARPILFWNPPWTLLVLAPVAVLPFDAATAAWLLVNVGLAALVAWASWELFGDDGAIPPAALAGSLLFVPFLETLVIGQLSALTAAMVLGALLALRRRRDLLAGGLIALWSIKPQATLVVALVVGVHVLACRRWRVVLGAVAGLGALVTLSALLFPETMAAWSPLQGPTEWRTASIAGWVRSWLSTDGAAPVWPLVVVPGIALLAVLPWALRHRSDLRWTCLPTVVAVSFFAAPHAWIFDAVLLLPIQTVLIGRAVGGERRAAWGVAALATIQLGAVAFRTLDWTTHQHLLWVPLAITVVWLLSSGPRAEDAGREQGEPRQAAVGTTA